MKLLQIMYSFVRNNNYLRKSYSILINSRSIDYVKCSCILQKNLPIENNQKPQLMHSGNDDSELFDCFPILVTEEVQDFQCARTILFQDSQDTLINELNKCVSVNEVLNLVKKTINNFEDKHAIQTIFVLRDLQDMFYHYNGYNLNTAKEFIDNLYNNQEFVMLLKYIGDSLNNFNAEYLSYVLLYLNKLGVSIENQLIQDIAVKVRQQLIEEFSLDRCSRFLEVIFTENSVRPYYTSVPVIPKVINQIGQCDSVKDLGDLTTCLNKLHIIVNNSLLEGYKEMVENFIKRKKLKSADYKVVLKIIFLLNYPKWRSKNMSMISDCIHMIENEISLLNAKELLVLHEVLYKNYEPGDILSSVQRCAAKFLQQFEDTESPDTDTKLKLFLSLLYFSSPAHRLQFKNDVEKYYSKCTDYSHLRLLNKIFSFSKISDKRMCTNYWNNCVEILDGDENSNILKLSQNYLSFSSDIDNFRHTMFERKINDIIERDVIEENIFYSYVVTNYLCFMIVYGKNKQILNTLMDKFEENLSQYKATDCLKLSQSLAVLEDVENSLMTKKDIKRLRKLLNDCSEKLLEAEDNNFFQNNMLLRASITRNDFDNYMCENLLMKYKEIWYMSSKEMESICFFLLSTDSLIPEVINKCTEYVIKQENNLLGFNVEKVLYLCYYLAYYPINAKKFFQVATDIIIRDQERLSGLSFVQSALALCYFNKLPSSFIKHIFNVEFLEKLDAELANCYSKDKYPQRVRSNLMQLNRAVCLEYPECNVPWFHKKYIDEILKKYHKDAENIFTQRVKEYLVKVLGKSDYIEEDIITPYGYHIDFVINLNTKEQLVPPNSPEVYKRFAILLIRQHAFTRFFTHLKGKFEFKKRHLEMFGYQVVFINFNEWINLLYAGERLEYISNLIWPIDVKPVNTRKR